LIYGVGLRDFAIAGQYRISWLVILSCTGWPLQRVISTGTEAYKNKAFVAANSLL
jgi:hypothetical protein